jgi:hypothetical protein
MILPPRRTIGIACAAVCLSAFGCATQQITVPVLPPLIGPPAPDLFWHEPFDALDTEQWRNVEVRGISDYAVVQLDGRSCLRASSRGAGSILLYPLRYEADTYEVLTWQWRVDHPVPGEALKRKDGSDAPARVYVYFDTPGLPWQKRSLDYVWSLTLPEGTLINSAYSAASKIIVVSGGEDEVGRWRTVSRNLQDDYRRAFGGDVPHVVALGLMTDSDNSKGESLAFFDEVRVTRRPGRGGSGAP